LVKRIKNEGCIIAISDIYADLPNSRFASYCSAKAGLQNLALSWAQSFSPNIRVNIIQPGPIKFLPEHSPQYKEMVLSQSLLRRELGYESVQQGISYLISAKGLTGSILKVDGGRSCVNHYEQTFNN
jgi:dihydromonapterin reductase/dihydrofolate reductase